MTDQIRENSKWFKEKGAVMRAYVKTHNEAFSAVAGRGFLQMPGFLYDIENDIETEAKLKLSEINFAILQDTIERELKQVGLSYDLSYKNLLMVWELTKQELMDAWEAELAGIKKDMAAKEEVLARLEIETASRNILLLEAKTEIDLQAEALRNQIAGLDDDTADYEVTLANQKLLTAQKKLEIIPILEQIIVKEQELLASEQHKLPYEEELIAAQQSTVSKEEELIPCIAQLASVTEEYGVELAKQTEIEVDIAEQKILDAGISIQKAEVRIEEAEARTAIEEKNLDLARAKITAEDASQEVDESVMKAQITSQQTLNGANASTDAVINAADKVTNQVLLADKEAVISIEEDTHTDAAAERANISVYQINTEAGYRASEIGQLAELEKTTRVTAALTHLLSM